MTTTDIVPNIEIPFQPYFKDTVRSGQKQMTSRTKRTAEVGDIFNAFGTYCQIVGVEQRPLWFIKSALYWYEGCQSPGAFERTWCQIHQKAGWTPDKLVWVHSWRRIQL